MKRLIVMLAGGALLAAPAVAQDNATLKAIGEGRGLYLANCAGCHGAHAKGDTTGTNGAVPDLTLIALRDGTFEPVHVVNHIAGRRDGLNPANGMPCWGPAFKQRWPRGDGPAALQIYKLTKYLAFVQEQPVVRRVASQ